MRASFSPIEIRTPENRTSKILPCSASRSPTKTPSSAISATTAHELFPELPTAFTAILEIRSASKIVVLPLLGIHHSRGQFLMSALAEEQDAASGGEATVPRFVAGEGYRTILYLLPSRNEAASGSIRFHDSSGKPVQLPFR